MKDASATQTTAKPIWTQATLDESQLGRAEAGKVTGWVSCVSVCVCLSVSNSGRRRHPARGPNRSGTALRGAHSAPEASLETLSKKSDCCLFLLRSEKQDSEYMLCK